MRREALALEQMSLSERAAKISKARRWPVRGARLADYWVVDPGDHVVEAFTLAGDAYRSTSRCFSGTATLTFGEVEVSLDIDALFG